MPLPLVMLTMAHFKQVRDAIWDARVKYQNIGIELGLSPDDVDAIVEDEGGKVEKCFVEVLKRCLKDGISQKKIADALQSTPVGYGYLGREFLDKKFAPHKEQHHGKFVTMLADIILRTLLVKYWMNVYISIFVQILRRT